MDDILGSLKEYVGIRLPNVIKKIETDLSKQKNIKLG